MCKITWYGHSALKIEIADKVLIVDPMLDNNPVSPVKAADIKKADAVYVTHDHPDHLGEAFDICKRTGAVFVAILELAKQASQNGVENTAMLNIGGTFPLGEAKLTIVKAVHSSNVGTPTGVMIQGEGLTIYDAGDTALFSDMKLFGDLYDITLACLPMGGNYTMDATQAVEAVKMLKPKMVLPIHYGTFPNTAKNADEFAKKIREATPTVKPISVRPGETFKLNQEKIELET